MDFCKLGLAVVETEAQAVYELTKRIDEHFAAACRLLLACKGRVIVSGMGKSGHIAKKIAATLSSTGTPAFFMHPAEACHGDAGMVTHLDLILIISKSGSTHEIITILPLLKRLSVPIIALSGDPNSTLAKIADVNIDLSIDQEACPLGLAPTTSTTVSLVMGDALAIALLQARGFDANDFARSHPSGALGRKLLLLIDDLCHYGDEIPIVSEYATIDAAIIEVSAKKLGMTCVIDHNGKLVGVYTDGDIRRTLISQYAINSTSLKDVMTHNAHTIAFGTLAAEALAIMHQHSISSLVVVDSDNRPAAVVHLHGLLRAGVL